VSQLIPNAFSSFSLTAEEEESGQVLNGNQRMVLQNKAAEIAQAKLNITFTPNDILAYAQQEAELQGQLGIIQWILDSSTAVELEQQLRNQQ